MVLTWNINNMFTDPILIACTAIFFGLFLISLILTIVLIIHKNIIQTIAKTIDLYDAITKSSLKNLIRRISNIYDETKDLEKEYYVWRTKFELIYEKQVSKIMLEFVKLLEDRSTTKPLISNYKNYQKVYQNLASINNTIYDLYVEIYSKIEVEFLQRDFVTYLKEVFSAIKEEVIIVTFKDYEIDHEKLNGIVIKIEELFEDFYINMEEGWLKASWDLLGKIKASLLFVIELLEAIPETFSYIKAVIPEKLAEIKNKYVTFGTSSREKLNLNANNYLNLEYQVDQLRIKALNQIKNLQYKKVRSTLEEIEDLILNFKDSVEYEDKLKKYFREDTENIKNNFDKVWKATWAIQKELHEAKTLSKIKTIESSQFEEARSKFISTKENIELIFSRFDVSESTGKEINLMELKEELLKALSNSIEDIEHLEKSAKWIEKNTINVASLINHVIFLQSLLNQCEVKINQYRSIKELGPRFLESINYEQDKLQEFLKQRVALIKTHEEKELASLYIEEVTNEIMTIVRDLKDAIFLDYISQEIMVYLERYVGKYNGMEELIDRCEVLFKQRQLEQLINLSLNTLGGLKKIRK
ncbi:septation ring formation regulator [Spiroplasma gladiatoris]|uniref:Septation ring formation regulator n=1 Tax=Spiroplasma gladiatoris TaxID=2143 RepID=A0A4P7AHZ0_9MOLU|nr:septation ring formation regulator EzrA [Spiroplasma gladiatoris]QBQ08064.1 septation ring formation regulator [Spiroplasma gladiatoris]